MSTLSHSEFRRRLIAKPGTAKAASAEEFDNQLLSSDDIDELLSVMGGDDLSVCVHTSREMSSSDRQQYLDLLSAVPEGICGG